MYKFVGYIAADTFTNRTNSHIANEDGNVICKSKCRFGYDCHTRIQFITINEFYLESYGVREGMWKNHLELKYTITCIKCQKLITKLIMANTTTVVIDGFYYHLGDDQIPTGAYYVATEENPRRLVVYEKHISGTLGSNPRLVITTNNPRHSIKL